MSWKWNIGLVGLLVVMGIALSAEGTSSPTNLCSSLDMIPAPYQRNGTVLRNFPLSCNIIGNFTNSSSFDFFTLLENEKVPIGLEDYFTVDVHLKCSAPHILKFSNNSMSNLKMILALRLEDCHVIWTDIDKLGQSVYLIELALTYIHILPLQSNNSATIILPGLANVLEITVGINFNLTADVLHIEKALPVFKNLSAMVLICYNSTFNEDSCMEKGHRRIQFNTTWLRTTYPDLQTLVLIGVIPSDNFSHLNFPWNNNTRYLPLNISRSNYLQNIYSLDFGGHGLSNKLRRILDISNTDITIDRVCPVNGHVNKIAFRLVRLKNLGFPYDCFWKTQNTTYIDINVPNINSVPNTTFKAMRQLRYLAIRRGNITEIKPGTFDDLESLLFLSLESNSITSIKKGVMSNLTSLETLYLHNNSINYMESESLPTYMNLSFVDVRWNNLSALVNDCLKLPKLVMCDMEHNYIYLSNLRQLLSNKEFDPIRLSIVEPYAYEGQPPQHYDEGYVHENDQSHLSLKNNGVVYIPFDADIWTSFEKLQFITFLSWIQIDMASNRLYCGCPLYNIKRWFLDTTTASWQKFMLAKYPGIDMPTLNNFNSWECGAPIPYEVELKYIHGPFMEVPDRYFLCDLPNSNCPNGCQCLQSPSNQSYYINCENKHLSEFPQHVPLPPEGKRLYVLLAKNHIDSLPDIHDQQNQTRVSGNNSIVPYAWLKRVTFLDLYQNRITADVYRLESFSYLLGDQLEVLKLDENDIQSIPMSFRNFPMLKNITLPYDRIKCCNSGWMKYWLRDNSDIVHNSQSLKCQNSGLSIVEMEDSEFVCSEPDPLRFLTFLILVPAIIIPLVCIKHAGEIKILVFEKSGIKLTFRKIARDDSKVYDAVLMYADQDHEWCAQTLLPHLEKGYQYKIFFKHRDGDLGVFTGTQRTNTLVQSYRAIVVLSNSFISDPDCMTFFSEARSYSTDKRFVLVIKLEHLRLDPDNDAHRDIFNFLRTNFYVDIKMNRCLARLCYWMPETKARALPLITENLPVGLEESHGPGIFAGSDVDD